jgi:hypothetical protein
MIVMAGPAASGQLEMEVRIQDYAGVHKGQWRVASTTAESVFLAAGVKIDWVYCSPTPGRFDIRCRATLGRNTRVVRILSRNQSLESNAPGDELGRALLNDEGTRGRFASIHHGQVIDLAAEALSGGSFLGYSAGMLAKPMLEARLLGYAIAHELSHLAGNRHASKGLMGAKWNRRELPEILAGTLRFSGTEARQIAAALLGSSHSGITRIARFQ